MSRDLPDPETIFAQAIELAASEDRTAFLDRACGRNADLRREVEKLVSDHFRAGGFLEKPAIQLLATADPPVSERPGTLIGPYKLMEQIGEGGMGLVFVAEQQQPVRRKVALKVLKPGMDTRQVIARFEAERQALALMEHPNIARVLDAGATPSGRPYFVMELVKGVPITEFCDDHQLTPRERLELFVSVCQAVQHAHQKGIIHRDVKPSNVMVASHDGTPVVKVIDFGVAKAVGQQLTEKTLYTAFTQMIGTPQYMSPEQAGMSSLDVDTRSDIYSLGVLLYELLTGTTPFDATRLQTATYDEFRRIIREEEPPRPSTRVGTPGPTITRTGDGARLARQATATAATCTPYDLARIAAQRQSDPVRLRQLLRGELDWIVMKALEKDRNRRYATASSLAADVQHYLNDEPVQACPPSAWYKLRKLARRRRGAFAIVSTALLIVLLAVVGLGISNFRISTEKNRTEQALGLVRREERQKTEQLWEALVAQARATRLSRRAGQRFESLEILQRATRLARTLELPAEKVHELRNAAIVTLAMPDLYLTGPWHDLPGDWYSFDFDEAHALYAHTDRQGACSIRRVADDVEIHRLPALGGPALPYLSPDGNIVALIRVNKNQTSSLAVQLWKLDEATPHQILDEQNARFVDFHRESQQIALAYNDGAIRLFELPTGRQLSRLAPDTLTRNIRIALHPTEPIVAVCSYSGSVVQLRDLRSGEVLASLPQRGHVDSVAWHPHGRTLAVGMAEARRIYLYDAGRIAGAAAHDGSETRPTLLQPFRTLETEQTASYLSFNHAGDRLVSTGWSAALELFDTGTGRKLFATMPLSGRMRFSKDDRRLAGGVKDGKVGIWQVGDGREYRTLRRDADATVSRQAGPQGERSEEAEYQSVAVNPDGRLLAAATTEGFSLWDLAGGIELTFISTGGKNNVVRFEPSGALLALGPAGLVRWPIREPLGAAAIKTDFKSAPPSDQWIMGPPEPLPLPRGHALDRSSDGRVIVTCSRMVALEEPYAGGWILHAERPSEPIRIDPSADIGWITVSPDGRWVVTVTHSPTGLAKVWDARDGTFVKQLAEWGAGFVRFSPDGRWLATDVDGGRLFAVGTWEPGPRVGERGVFAPDSRLLAVQPTAGVIRLVDSATGREWAQLEDPNLHTTQLPVFTPDGTKLIGHTSNGIMVWDLRLIRRHLAKMVLDWDAPPYPPARPENKTSVFPKVEVDLGDDARLSNNLAWLHVTVPPFLRDVATGLRLAEKAVHLEPASAVYRNTLGVAYYRAGRYQEAVDTLRANLDSQEDWALAFDLYFLAMGHHQLGETARARDYYDWAVRWTQSQQNLSAQHLEELNLFRAEAAELLGVKDRTGE